MQLKFFLAGALLPLGLMANPAAEAEAAAADVMLGGAGEALEARAFSRPQQCTIVGGSSTVNCRRGSGTKWSVTRKLRRGTTYRFWCVKSGECVTVNGKRNWYVKTAITVRR
jgi:hypothetical protein